MTPAIHLLLIQILQLGALLAADPCLVVFTSTHGHTQKVSVEIYPVGSVWRTGHPTPAPIAHAEVHWEPYRSPFDDDEMYADALQRTQRELEFMRAALHAYLPAEADQPEAQPGIQMGRPESGTLYIESVSSIAELALNGGQAELLIKSHDQDHRIAMTADRVELELGYGLECSIRAYGQRHTLSLNPGDGIYAARLCEWVEAIAAGTAAAA